MSIDTLTGPDEDEPRDAEVFDLGTGRRIDPATHIPDDPDPDEQDPDDLDLDEDEDGVDDGPLLVPALLGAARIAARQGAYVLGGARVAVRNTRDARGTTRHHRFMRAAEAIGDHATALEWEQRVSAFRKDRHERRMSLLMAPVHVAQSLAVGAGVLLAFGLAWGTEKGQIGDVLRPLMDVVNAVETVCAFLAVTWRPLLLSAMILSLMGLWSVGRKYTDPPGWLMPAGPADTTGDPITPSIVVIALRDLGVAKLKTAIQEMGDVGAAMLSPITIAGCGVELDVTLPSGVSTLDVQTRRRRLAENLGRHEHEVFITIAPAARTVHLWIADSGALDEPIGPSPLVTDPTIKADMYTGRAPWGQDLRGDAVGLSLHQRHVLITGLSNQGKTASLRSLALWAVLDRTVEVWLGDLKGIGDWRMFDRLATVLIQGPTDEHVMAVVEMVEAGVEEMERRTVAAEESGSTEGVTRDMARKPGGGFHPLIIIVDEAQVAFMCPAVGQDKRPYGGSKATSRYFMAVRKLHNQGRAVNVLLWEGTQDPTDQNLPKLVREGAHIRASLVVGTEAQSRMALGDKAVNSGAAPHNLRQGKDKGTVVVAGDGVDLPPGQSSLTIRTHYIDGKDATRIANRAKALRKAITTRTATAEPEPPRDLLADLAEVLGEESTPAADLPALLRSLAPAWRPYAAMTGKELREQLAGLGVKVASTGNRYPLDPAAVRRAQLHRAEKDPSDTGE